MLRWAQWDERGRREKKISRGTVSVIIIALNDYKCNMTPVRGRKEEKGEGETKVQRRGGKQ